MEQEILEDQNVYSVIDSTTGETVITGTVDGSPYYNGGHETVSVNVRSDNSDIELEEGGGVEYERRRLGVRDEGLRYRDLSVSMVGQQNFEPQIVDVYCKEEPGYDWQTDNVTETKNKEHHDSVCDEDNTEFDIGMLPSHMAKNQKVKDEGTYSPEFEGCSMYMYAQQENECYNMTEDYSNLSKTGDQNVVEDNFNSAIEMVIDEITSHAIEGSSNSLLKGSVNKPSSTIKIEPLEEPSSDQYVSESFDKMETDTSFEHNDTRVDPSTFFKKFPCYKEVKCTKPQCIKSKQTYRGYNDLVIHLKYFHEGHKYHCEVAGCGESFNNKEDSFGHFIKLHADESLMNALREQATTSEETDRADGLPKYCAVGQEDRMQCDTCDKTFLRGRHLTEHKNFHLYQSLLNRKAKETAMKTSFQCRKEMGKATGKATNMSSLYGRQKEKANSVKKDRLRKCLVCGDFILGIRQQRLVCEDCVNRFGLSSEELLKLNKVRESGRKRKMEVTETETDNKKARNVGSIKIQREMVGMKCIECNKVIQSRLPHFRTLQACLHCGYRTSCLSSYTDHMLNWHQNSTMDCDRPFQPVFSKGQMTCTCGLTATGDFWIATHLTTCDYCKDFLSPNVVLLPDQYKKTGSILQGYIRLVKSGGVYRAIKYFSSNAVQARCLENIRALDTENTCYQDTKNTPYQDIHAPEEELTIFKKTKFYKPSQFNTQNYAAAIQVIRGRNRKTQDSMGPYSVISKNTETKRLGQLTQDSMEPYSVISKNTETPQSNLIAENSNPSKGHSFTEKSKHIKYYRCFPDNSLTSYTTPCCKNIGIIARKEAYLVPKGSEGTSMSNQQGQDHYYSMNSKLQTNVPAVETVKVKYVNHTDTWQQNPLSTRVVYHGNTGVAETNKNSRKFSQSLLVKDVNKSETSLTRHVYWSERSLLKYQNIAKGNMGKGGHDISQNSVHNMGKGGCDISQNSIQHLTENKTNTTLMSKPKENIPRTPDVAKENLNQTITVSLKDRPIWMAHKARPVTEMKQQTDEVQTDTPQTYSHQQVISTGNPIYATPHGKHIGFTMRKKDPEESEGTNNSTQQGQCHYSVNLKQQTNVPTVEIARPKITVALNERSPLTSEVFSKVQIGDNTPETCKVFSEVEPGNNTPQTAEVFSEGQTGNNTPQIVEMFSEGQTGNNTLQTFDVWSDVQTDTPKTSEMLVEMTLHDTDNKHDEMGDQIYYEKWAGIKRKHHHDDHCYSSQSVKEDNEDDVGHLVKKMIAYKKVKENQKIVYKNFNLRRVSEKVFPNEIKVMETVNKLDRNGQNTPDMNESDNLVVQFFQERFPSETLHKGFIHDHIYSSPVTSDVDTDDKQEVLSDHINIFTLSKYLTMLQCSNSKPTEISKDLFNIWAIHNYSLPLWRHLRIRKNSHKTGNFNLRLSDNVILSPACRYSTDNSLNLFFLDKEDLLQHVMGIGGSLSSSEEGIRRAVNILLDYLKKSVERIKME